MSEWIEFIVFIGLGAWFFCAGLYLTVMLSIFGSGDRREALLCLALLIGGGTFIGVALRDAPFTVSLKEHSNGK
jgi:hypothetical protein